MRDLILTDQAEADLEEIGDYFATQNPAYAVRLIARLRENCLAIAENPEMYSRVPRHEHAGVRRMVSDQYLIFYIFTPTAVTVLRFLQGARDFDAILFPEDSAG